MTGALRDVGAGVTEVAGELSSNVRKRWKAGSGASSSVFAWTTSPPAVLTVIVFFVLLWSSYIAIIILQATLADPATRNALIGILSAVSAVMWVLWQRFTAQKLHVAQRAWWVSHRTIGALTCLLFVVPAVVLMSWEATAQRRNVFLSASTWNAVLPLLLVTMAMSYYKTANPDRKSYWFPSCTLNSEQVAEYSTGRNALYVTLHALLWCAFLAVFIMKQQGNVRSSELGIEIAILVILLMVLFMRAFSRMSLRSLRFLLPARFRT